MQAPSWTDFLQCSVCTNKYDSSHVVPISLSCGHTLCKKCLAKLKTRICPYDKTTISTNAESLPPNSALLQLLGQKDGDSDAANFVQLELSEENKEQYKLATEAIEELALFLQPLAEQGVTLATSHLTRPMLKKLVTVVNCQVLEAEGRARALRAARSIADRTITELLVMHQNQQQISTLLWTAVRNRGCQFLGPVMQEETLKLILKALESGKFLSRKTIVLYVVQQLQRDFPQASKTSVGHVVQLLYRASCFNVEKREEDSSLMQLKEEFCSYESLRREHDAQIIRVAMEAGLRISPEQWSTLLYGDHKHKSDMQSIIDKLIALGAASSGLNELIVAVGRSQDPYNLSEKIIPHLEVLLKVDINIDKNSELVGSWMTFAESMRALVATLEGFTTFMQIQSGRYRTGMCPYLTKPGGCPRGDKCTYAHSEEERDRFRSLAKTNKVKSRTEMFPTKPSPMPMKAGTAPVIMNTKGGRVLSGDLGPASMDSSPYSSLGAYDGPVYGTSLGYPPGMTPDHYSSSETFDSLGYPSYPTGADTHRIVLPPGVPLVGHDPSLSVLQTAGGQVYPATPQVVGYVPSSHHRHSGPHIAMYDGGRHVVTGAETYYATQQRRSGPIMEEKGYSRAEVYPYGRKPENEGGTSYSSSRYYHSLEEGNGNMMASQGTSSIASSLAEVETIKRIHKSVKESIESSSRGETPISDSSRGEGLEYPSSVTVSGETRYEPSSTHTEGGPNRVSYPPSSLAEYADSGPHPSHTALPKDDFSRNHNAEGTGKPVSPETLGYYPASSGSYAYSGSSSPQVVAKGASAQPHDIGGSAVTFPEYEGNLQGRIAKLHVSGSSDYIPTHQSAATYGTAVSDSHSHYVGSIPRSGVGHGTYMGTDYPKTSEELMYTYASVSSSEESTPVTSGSLSSQNTEIEDLKDQVRLLQQRLKEKEATIEKQSRRMVKSHPTSSPSRHSGPQSYSGRSPHHSGPIQHQFSGPIAQVHYSPHNTMQLYPTAPVQGGGSSYYHQPQPRPGYPHQWGAPLSGSFSGSLSSISPTASLTGNLGSIQNTPPPTGYIVPSAGGHIMMQQHPHQHDSNLQRQSDEFLAVFLQQMEQQKAAAQAPYTPSPMMYSHPHDPYLHAATPYAYEATPPGARQYVYAQRYSSHY